MLFEFVDALQEFLFELVEENCLVDFAQADVLEDTVVVAEADVKPLLECLRHLFEIRLAFVDYACRMKGVE